MQKLRITVSLLVESTTLSGCQRCRLVVADIVKAQRESDLPLPPVRVIEKAMGFVEKWLCPGRRRLHANQT
jgi:hypothetical protein